MEEGEAEESGISTWVIIVIVIVAIAVVGLVVYLGTRRKRA
jgi:flagellar basal body-associated protein FliL